MEKSVIFLHRCGTDEDVDAELWDDISEIHVEQWRDTWSPMIEHAKNRLKAASVPPGKWPQDLHWEWDKKTDWSRKFLTLKRFAICYGGALQGLMLVNLTKLTGRITEQLGKDLAYIDFVSTAPWNRPDVAGVQQFSGVGTNMVRAAIELSRNEGFHGRIGLHSLGQSEIFYGKSCGMTSFGPDAAYENMRYFEMTQAQADTFCGEA